LKSGDSSIYGSHTNGDFRHRAVAFIVAMLLMLVAFVFFKYGFWNIYDGPNDWRG
jgi:hypothetical protein